MWADAVPNLLIGLREGLEGGLVVTILLAAVRKAGGGASTRPVWFGVAAAVTLALSFGAVLTFSDHSLSTRAQEGFGGILSVVAVGLVTWMVFWMRRTARTLSGELKAKVANALALGGGTLAVTALLAVGREGMETALFLWTAAQAAGDTTAPLVGALIGVGIGVGLCWLLYRSTIRINLGTFFSRTALLLIVVAAGVLSYGLGELQNALLLPGRDWVAFDLTPVISADSWWVTILTGVTNLALKMSWLQVAAYLAYAAVTITAFRRAGRTPAPAPAKPAAAPPPKPAEDREPVPAGRRVPRWGLATAALLVPVAAALVLVVAAPGRASAGTVTVTGSACAPGWQPPAAGTQTLTVVNKSSTSGEIYLIQPSTGGVVGELENLGPGTRRTIQVTLASGDYAWRCVMAGRPERVSATQRVTGGSGSTAAGAVTPVSLADLAGPERRYLAYVGPQLTVLARQVTALRADLAGDSTGDLARARADWLAAQLTWDSVGAAYGSFGDLGDAIDGLPQGLPGGVHDAGFTGLHRLEYGLWHAEPAATLLPVATRLVTDVSTLSAKLPDLTADPTDLPVRAHEILEDALRDRLSGHADLGSGTTYPQVEADVRATRVVLGLLADLVDARRPHLLPTIDAQLTALERALAAAEVGGAWLAPDATPLAARQGVQTALGGALESLSLVPTLLEVRK